MVTYEEPTNPPELEIEPKTESHALHMLCIHHKNTPIESDEHIQEMNTIANTLYFYAMFIQLAPPMLLDTLVSHNTKWSKLTCPPPPTKKNLYTPPITNLILCLPLKYPP